MSLNFNRLPFYYIGHTIADAGCDIYVAASAFAAAHAPWALPRIKDDFSALKVLRGLAPKKSRFGVKSGRYGFWPCEDDDF